MLFRLPGVSWRGDVDLCDAVDVVTKESTSESHTQSPPRDTVRVSLFTFTVDLPETRYGTFIYSVFIY